MPVTATPAFVQAVKTYSAVATTAKSTYNNSTNAVKIFDANVTNGSIVRLLTAIPRVTTTATQLQLYRSPDNGTTMQLIKTKLLGATTVNATTEAALVDFGYTDAAPLWVAAGSSLWVAVGVTFDVVFSADVGDL